MGKNCNNKIDQILEEGRKCQAKFGNIGPTGPTGPAGPVTVAVGTTTTGDPGTPATVSNTGTSENAVLTFSIPAGATGPTAKGKK